jgi:Mrp family chromosome partitioning ATPase/capsular polysaccharide biosynthesis protein
LNVFPEQSVAPGRREGALPAYLAAIRAHRVVVALVTLTTVAASLAFLLARSPQYEATADVLVSPLPAAETTVVLPGLPLLRDVGDPVRTVQTAASLIESRAAADLAARQLGAGWDADRVLDAVEVAPRGESNVLGVTATADDPEEAARVANTFTRAALDTREEEIVEAAQGLVTQQEASLEALPPGDPVRETVGAQLQQLQSIVAGGDPGLSLSQEALPPDSAVGASPALIVALALLAGFALGSGTAVLLELFTRGVQDEEQAISLYPLPVLARVPLLPARARRAPSGSNWFLPPPVREAFRTLAVQLEQRKTRSEAIMVTSATAGDGKTTSAINLAVSLAAVDKRVVLLDFDLRHPQVGTALGLPGGNSLADMLDPNRNLEDFVVQVSELWSLGVLAVRAPEDALTDAVSLRLPELVEQARSMADCVIVDTPPLGEVSDALNLVSVVDDILVVIRPGNTRRGHLAALRELLDRVGYRPAGAVILGSAERLSRSYSGYVYGVGPPRALAMSEGDAAETQVPDGAVPAGGRAQRRAPERTVRAAPVSDVSEPEVPDADEALSRERPKGPARRGRPGQRD